MGGFVSPKAVAATNDTITFDRITAPVGRDRFLLKYWTRQAVHLREDTRTFEDVFGWDGLNAILNAHDLAFPQVKMSRSESPIPPEKFTTDVGGHRLVNTGALLELFRDGASFGITGADSRWAPLRSVVDCLYDVLLESIHTNVYCSPPNTQGFQCHFDLHEVFVLQMEGKKRWRVFWPTSESPVESWRAEDAPTAAEPYVDVMLQKGDVLYVPRGHWHYAVAQDSISVHVTVGVTCRKGTAFLDWLSGELLGRPEWRRNAPLMEVATSTGTLGIPHSFAEWTDGLKESLVRKISEPDLYERFWRAMFDGIRPSQGVDMTIQTGIETLPIEALVFHRPAGRRHVITAKGDSIVVSAGGCEIALEAADTSLIERIFESDSFTAADLRASQPSLNNEEVSELIRELIRSGLLHAKQMSDVG